MWYIMPIPNTIRVKS